jgi:hypothetical protein
VTTGPLSSILLLDIVLILEGFVRAVARMLNRLHLFVVNQIGRVCVGACPGNYALI